MLIEKGKASVANLGTFSATSGSASFNDKEGVMLPPSLKIGFSENRYQEEGYSLLGFAKEKVEAGEEELAQEMERLVEGIKKGLSEEGKYRLEGLGTLKKPMDGGPVTLEQDQDLLLGPESFGLPKIEPKPLSANEMTPPPVEKQSNQLMIAAIAIPLAVVFIVFLYFLYNKQAYDSVISYFDKAPAVVTGTSGTVENQDSLQAVADNNLMEGQDEEKSKADATSGKDNSTSEDAAAADDGNASRSEAGSQNSSSSDMVVASSDNRFYVIIGSYSDMASAEKKARQCRKIGYGTAKVVKRNDRIRVSLEDFAQKSDASQFAAKVGKDYAGAWVFSN